MEQEKKDRLGFFKRAYLAITDFRIYPFIQREGTGKAFLYFAKILVTISIIFAVGVTALIINAFGELKGIYQERVPEFEIKNGELVIETKLNKALNDIYIVIDTDKNYSDISNSDEKLHVYDEYMLIGKDGIEYKKNGESGRMDFRGIEDNLISKGIVFTYIESFMNRFDFKVIVFLLAFCIVFIAYIMMNVVRVFFLILVTYVINVILFRLKLKFGNYFRIVTYALTFPLIIEMIVLLTIGYIPNYAYIAFNLLLYIYLFYALRAIKLDEIIMNAPTNVMENKTKSIIQKMSEEAENHLGEDSKDKEKNNDLQYDNNKENDEDKKDDE